MPNRYFLDVLVYEAPFFQVRICKLGGGLNVYPTIIKEMIQFDEHIFSDGENRKTTI